MKKRRHGDDDVYYMHVSPAAAELRPGHGGARGRPRALGVEDAIQHALTAETPKLCGSQKGERGPRELD